MPQSLFQNYVHIVFSTKNRCSWLRDYSIRSEMFRYLTTVCQSMQSPVLTVNGYHDHVHLLIRMAKAGTVPTLIGEMKEDSSKWIKTKGGIYLNFYWQSGYGAFSVSASHVKAVQKYIENQENHHASIGFQEEYRRILQRNLVAYDEKYVWD